MLRTILCPKCGAPVELDDAQTSALCTYCGTKSFATSPRGGGVVAAPRAGGAGVLIAVLALGILVVAGGVAGMLMLSPASPPPATLTPSPPMLAIAPTPSASPPVPVALPAPPRAITQVLQGVTPLVSDVDGNQQPELIVAIRSTLANTTTEHFAVFDPRTGAERARTPALDDLSAQLAAARGGRLVLAGSRGQLTAYDLVSGDQQWTTTLGDRVTAICDTRTPDALHVESDDERRLLVDLTTGRQTETREPCATLLARGAGQGDPRDRRDYSAPPGIEAIQCGGVRVMGSANFSVPDQCNARAHVRSDQLAGMVGHRMWRIDGGWLVFGVRQPGAYVPMVGRLGRGTNFVWKSEVPVSNPLDADTGGPRHVAMIGDTLLIGYETSGNPHSMLTAFATADGVRRFSTPLSATERIHAMVPVGDAVAVQIGDSVRVFAAADGSARTTIGEAEAPEE